MDALQAKGDTQGVIANPFLPVPTVLGSIEDQQRFIDILKEKRFITSACQEYPCSTYTIWTRMEEFPQFKAAVHAVKRDYERQTLDRLEEVSITVALDPINGPERMFQLKGHNPAKYAPKHGQQAPMVINIQTPSLHIGDRAQFLVKSGVTPPSGRGQTGRRIQPTEAPKVKVLDSIPDAVIDDKDLNI